MYQAHGIPVRTGFVTAAFGCNFEGDVQPARVVDLVAQMRAVARDMGEDLSLIGLGDTMAWATPERIRRVVGIVRRVHEGFGALGLPPPEEEARNQGLAGPAVNGLDRHAVSQVDADDLLSDLGL